MKRRATVVWSLAAVAAGAFSIVVNTEVQKREDRLERVNRRVVETREAIDVLRAEWSYLNRPGRLEDIARRRLALRPPGPGQVVRVSDLPFAAGAEEWR